MFDETPLDARRARKHVGLATFVEQGLFHRQPPLSPSRRSARPATAHIMESSPSNGSPNLGTTVLGSYPGYVALSDLIGARRFDLGPSAWSALSPADPWAANRRFLDQMLAANDTFVLSVDPRLVRPGTWFARDGARQRKHGASAVGHRQPCDGRRRPSRRPRLLALVPAVFIGGRTGPRRGYCVSQECATTIRPEGDRRRNQAF